MGTPYLVIRDGRAYRRIGSVELEIPSAYEWARASVAGFRSNGSTLSTDWIFGVRIATGDNTWPPLAADLHDYRYFVGGAEDDRARADDEHYAWLLASIEATDLDWTRRLIARLRARARHAALRAAGWARWRYRAPTP